MNNHRVEAQIPDCIFDKHDSKHPKFTKYIIDTDGGGDDVHSILIAQYVIQKYRPDAQIVGVTAVAGVATMQNAITNLRIGLDISVGKRPKLYKGCHSDILRRGYNDNFYLEDGLGGSVQNHYLEHLKLNETQFDHFHEEQHAVDFIIKSVQEYGDELCIISLGPMTNIFLAQQLYPKMVTLLGGLCIMGGTYLSVGNSIVNSCGEFNFQTDVDAVASVLKSPYRFVTIMPFEICLGVPIEEKFVESIFKDRQQTIRSEMVKKIFEKICVGDVPFYLCDQICVILAMMPELIGRGFQKHVKIVQDGFARGQMIIDWFGKLKSEANCFIITGIDAKFVQQIVEETNL